MENTLADLDWARKQKGKVPPEQIEQRKRDTLTITLILLSHRADIDADDGYGATALYEAVYLKKLELAKMLLRFDAKVNTKTGIYIDGSGDITPLHRAYWSAELTKLLLDKGADSNAKDTGGKTQGIGRVSRVIRRSRDGTSRPNQPLHWTGATTVLVI